MIELLFYMCLVMAFFGIMATLCLIGEAFWNAFVKYCKRNPKKVLRVLDGIEALFYV